MKSGTFIFLHREYLKLKGFNTPVSFSLFSLFS